MEAMENYDDDEEELLSLGLAIVGDYSGKKRKRSSIRRSLREININLMSSPLINSNNNILEGKVYRLLQMREQMLKQDQLLLHKKRLISSPPTRQDHDHDDQANPSGLRLIHLLLVAAAAAAEAPSAASAAAALESLSELYAGASSTGDAVQRVVAHFADGLAARLLRTRRSPFFGLIAEAVPTAAEEFSAFIGFYRASPLHQFAHFTANQAIIEAFERDQQEEEEGEDDDHHHHHQINRALHVIDFDVSYGLQWPSLIQSLADKASREARTISLRLTGLGRSQDELRETEDRLVSFSKPFRNLSFEFKGLLIRPISPGNNNNTTTTTIDHDLIKGFKIKRNETVAVNLLLFHSSNNNDVVKGASVSAETLRLVREALNPSVVVLVEREGQYSSSPRGGGLFLPRFMESLHYYAAMFDSLDDGLPRDSAERLGIERNHLGREIIRAMVMDDRRVCSTERRFDDQRWRERMLGHGFGGVRISSKALIQAKLLLKMRAQQYCCFPQVEVNNGGGFRVFERDEGMAISLGWQDRCLITASVWQCVCDSS